MSVRLSSGDSADRVLGWLFLPLLILMAWWTVSLGSGRTTWCFLDYVNLPFHEAGHVFLRPFGKTIHYLGGTIFQLTIPLGLCVYFILRNHKPFAAALCFWWFGQNFINIGWYMSSARTLDIPLVGGGDHDWNELFYRFNLLTEDSVVRVSTLTHRIGVVLMLIGLAWAVHFVLPPSAQDRIKDTLASRFPALRLLLE